MRRRDVHRLLPYVDPASITRAAAVGNWGYGIVPGPPRHITPVGELHAHTRVHC